MFTYLDWQPVVANRTGLANFNPAVHFLAGYSEPESYPDANPKGLSGSARWGRKSSTPEVWHPNIDILGVTVTYYKKQALLKMIRRKAVLEFLNTIQSAA